MSDAWNAREVILKALDLDGEARDAYLASACPDEASRQAIAALLEHYRDQQTSTRPAGAPPATGDPRTGAGSGFENGSSLGLGAADRSSDPASAGFEGGRHVGKYRLIKLLGVGGMGEVWLAEEEQLERLVAIKFVRENIPDRAMAFERFSEEARLAARVSHPNVVVVHEFVTDAPRPYLVTEYIAGPPLSVLIESERERRERSPDDADAIVAWHRTVVAHVSQVANAVHACHKAQTIHRDIKPSNILIDVQRGACITDFGVAKRLDRAGLTMTADSMIGSLPYMSPEQIEQRKYPVGERSDIFSLGVVLYEALTLQRPFPGSDVLLVSRAVCHDDPIAPQRIDPLIPKQLENVVMQALEKAPHRRYPTAGLLAGDLDSWLTTGNTIAPAKGRVRKTAEWIARRRGVLVSGVAALAILVIAVLGGALLTARDAQSAFIAVDAPRGSRVFVQTIDPDQLDLSPEVVESRRAPIRRLRLAPGAHRITVVTSPPSTFVEFDVRLLAGRENQHRLVVVEADQPWPTPAPRTLVGRAVDTDRFRDDGVTEVAGGLYTVGVTADPDPLLRERALRLHGFLIDRQRVSNAEYRAYMLETNAPAPRIWWDLEAHPELADRPVVGITVDEAEAYARWRGKRLPTAWEWDAAVRGPNGRRFPWDGLSDEERKAMRTATMPSDETIRIHMQTTDLDEIRTLYRTHTRSVRAADPLAPHLGGLLHAFGVVRDLTSTVDPSTSAVVVKGRHWAQDVDSTELGRNLTAPIFTFAPEHGFRLARTLHPPTTARSESER